MTIPHGIYIWQIDQLQDSYISDLVSQNCARVYLKVLDDASPGIFWPSQCNKENVAKFTQKGIEVVPWGYIFDRRVKTNTAGIVEAVRKAQQAGCVGFVADVEEEVKNPATHAQLEDILNQIKAIVPPGTLGYTSFGNPEVHPEVPWAMLQRVCDYQQPQMYYQLWGSGSNKGEIEEAFAQHKRMGLTQKPLYPIFTAEDNSKGQASPVSELQWFLDHYAGSSIYAAQCPNSWGVNYRGAVSVPNEPPAAHKGQVRPYQPAPVPLPFTSDLHLGDSNQQVFVLHCALAGLGLLASGPQPEEFTLVTKDVVQLVQQRNKLTIDGWVGPKTKAAIEKMLTAARNPPPKQGTVPGAKVNALLSDFYSDKSNYDQVYNNVMSWYGTLSNACVAFMSTALRMAGTPVPHGAGYGGDDISLVTLPFYKWLESKGWGRVKAAELMAGDVCFTTDNLDYPGYPAHTYMFHSWVSKSEWIANVIDNQSFVHARNIDKGGNEFNFSPFAFALRSPV